MGSFLQWKKDKSTLNCIKLRVPHILRMWHQKISMHLFFPDLQESIICISKSYQFYDYLFILILTYQSYRCAYEIDTMGKF